jgi:hypothetical protein
MFIDCLEEILNNLVPKNLYDKPDVAKFNSKTQKVIFNVNI